MENVIQLNQDVIKRIALLKRKERLAHAYMFIGPNDIGKGETALAVAKLVNCVEVDREVACDMCPSCMKINSGNHPDLFIIDNGFGESIKIAQIRELLDRSKLKPFLAAKKVIIIKNIENLTLESANAFLKTLEEPAADTLILLTTSVPERNLDTIRSRCHAIFFAPASSSELVRHLKKDSSLNDQSSHFLAFFAQGCLGTALNLREERFIERKNGLINMFILHRPDEASVKALLADKQQTKEYLGILLSWIRDALLAKSGVEDKRLVHCDRISDLRQFSQKYAFGELNEMNKSVVKMCQLLADKLNIKIPLLIIGEQLWGI